MFVICYVDLHGDCNRLCRRKKKKKVTHYMTIKERDDASDLHFLCIISKFLMIDLLLILEVGCT